MNSWNPCEVSHEKRALKEIAGLGRRDGERIRAAIERFASDAHKPRHKSGDLQLELYLQ